MPDAPPVPPRCPTCERPTFDAEVRQWLRWHVSRIIAAPLHALYWCVGDHLGRLLDRVIAWGERA